MRYSAVLIFILLIVSACTKTINTPSHDGCISCPKTGKTHQGPHRNK
jgi:hypothetical protein